jgi:hypothetical protein
MRNSWQANPNPIVRLGRDARSRRDLILSARGNPDGVSAANLGAAAGKRLALARGGDRASTKWRHVARLAGFNQPDSSDDSGALAHGSEKDCLCVFVPKASAVPRIDTAWQIAVYTEPFLSGADWSTENYDSARAHVLLFDNGLFRSFVTEMLKRSLRPLQLFTGIAAFCASPCAFVNYSGAITTHTEHR